METWPLWPADKNYRLDCKLSSSAPKGTSFREIASCVKIDAAIFAADDGKNKQEAQLPQRNSASAAHIDWGLGPPAHSLSAPMATPMRMVESETRNKRTSNVSSTKCTLRWIRHLRSFKVILIGASRNLERCVVVMCN